MITHCERCGGSCRHQSAMRPQDRHDQCICLECGHEQDSTNEVRLVRGRQKTCADCLTPQSCKFNPDMCRANE